MAERVSEHGDDDRLMPLYRALGEGQSRWRIRKIAAKLTDELRRDIKELKRERQLVLDLCSYARRVAAGEYEEEEANGPD